MSGKNVVVASWNTAKLPTDVQETRSPQKVSPMFGLTVLSTYPLKKDQSLTVEKAAVD